MLRMLVFILVAFVLFFVFTSLMGVYLYTKPHRIQSSTTPENLGLGYEEVSFTTSDGILLRGWFIPHQTSTKTIILLHGWPADKGNILPSYAFLAQHYNLLLFDFRRLGESEGQLSTIGGFESRDVLAAVEFLKNKQLNEIGILGFSMGGAAGLMATPQVPEIKAVISDSSYAQLDLMVPVIYQLPFLDLVLAQLTKLWVKAFIGFNINDINPAAAVETTQTPIFIIHSRLDRVISFEHAQLFQQALSNNKQAEFLFHNELHGVHPLGYQEQILEFFQKHL